MIHSFDYAKKNIGETGTVLKSDRSIASVSGLAGAKIGEGISFENGTHGMVTKLGEDSTEIMIFSDKPLPSGEQAARTGESLKISVGDGMLGDTFDALGHITSREKEPSKKSQNRPVESEAGNMETRAQINQFCQTGVTIVDTVVPIAKGQRELIMGDQKTGKTHFLMSAIKSQAKLGTICILGLIGKEQSEIARIESQLDQSNLRNNCIIIAEPASASAARLTLVPFTAMSVAEHFRDLGIDTFLVIDDLAHHAVRYREMALLSDRFPGRDSYPSDIFYLHARLLERAGVFNIDRKSVAITCLPVVTTVDGDISGYIQTNLMSMTDGHLYFDKNLFFDGVRPAVNIFLSVTRVGRQTQSKLAREIGQKVLTIMNEYGELKRFLRFGTELTDRVKESIRLAHGIKAILKQNGSVSIDPNIQIWLFATLWAGRWDGEGSETRASKILQNKAHYQQILEAVNSVKKFDDLVSIIRKNESIS